MPAERVSMRRVREILRLKHGGASDRQIARSLRLARSTVGLTLQRAAAAGLRWPLPATLTDRVLEATLYAGHAKQQGARRKAEPEGKQAGKSQVDLCCFTEHWLRHVEGLKPRTIDLIDAVWHAVIRTQWLKL